MNLERIKKLLMYLLIFSIEFALIVAILVWINHIADTPWIWSRPQ